MPYCRFLRLLKLSECFGRFRQWLNSLHKCLTLDAEYVLHPLFAFLSLRLVFPGKLIRTAVQSLLSFLLFRRDFDHSSFLILHDLWLRCGDY